MRVKRAGLIHLVAVLCACHTTLSNTQSDQRELSNLVAQSPYSVPFADYITEAELPAGQALELTSVSARLCGSGFVNSSGEVSRSLLQDITELAIVNVSTYYYVDVVKAVPAKAAATFREHESGNKDIIAST